MPRKCKDYVNVIFKAEPFQEALKLLESLPKNKKETIPDSFSNSIDSGPERWSHDSEDEFFSDYRKGFEYARFSRRVGGRTLEVSVFRHDRNSLPRTTIDVSVPDHASIAKVFAVFDRNEEQSRLPLPEKPKSERLKPVIFIGHGRSPDWRDLKDHLQDKHHFEVSAYEIGSREGHTIRDILEDMLTKSSIAFLVLTAEDETKGGGWNPRLNVVHELGLFQGRLGFARAIAVLEKGATEFSNIHGIAQIRFGKGNIKETFGDMLAVIRREFPGN